MITVVFFHESLPGGLSVKMPVVPQKSEAVYLDETMYVVTLVNHVVYSDSVACMENNVEWYRAFVYLATQEEYTRLMYAKG